MTEITQADRDAAADLYEMNVIQPWDEEMVARAFARHRMAERTAIAAWLREQDEIAFQEWIEHASTEYDNKLARIVFQIEQGEYTQ